MSSTERFAWANISIGVQPTINLSAVIATTSTGTPLATISQYLYPTRRDPRLTHYSMPPPISIPAYRRCEAHAQTPVQDGGATSAVRDAWNVLLQGCSNPQGAADAEEGGRRHSVLGFTARRTAGARGLIPLTMDHESRVDEDTAADAVRSAMEVLCRCYTYTRNCLDAPHRRSQHSKTLRMSTS